MPGANNLPSLMLEGVTRRFGRRAAVDRASLSVAKGETVCLLGPSGCGKTTTLRIAAGVEHADEGRVLIDGATMQDAATFVPPEKRGVGLMFQDFALFPHLSVLRNVTFGLDRLARRERDARGMAELERVGLTHLARAFPHQLSGGEQQRVALARALAPSPHLMLMDEPFSGLDERLRDAVRDRTLDLLKQTGAAALVVTHDPSEAMRIADRIALMRAGRIVQVGSPDELYNRPVDAGAAAFFSDHSAVEGTVESGAVSTTLGRFAAPRLAEGVLAQALIRPEAVEIIGAGGTAARVVRWRLIGASGLAELEAQSVALMARTAAHPALAPGESVQIRVIPERVLVFAKAQP
jgi:iron(III) transport system ATP-binding protein